MSYASGILRSDGGPTVYVTRRVPAKNQEVLIHCPFCESLDLEICNTHTPSYWVECHGCGAQAHGKSFKYTTKQHNDFHSKPLPRPYVLARRSAIQAWNRRAA